MAYTYGSETNCTVANGQTRSEYKCRLGYQVESQSIANNTSTITLRLEVKSTSSSYATYGYNQTTTIDGTSLSAKSFDMRSTNSWQVFGERTITVSHNSDGTYSSNKSGSFTTTASSGYSLKSGSASVTVNPSTIPRYATITKFNITGRTSSSISAEWATDVYCDRIDYSLNGGSWVNFSSSGTFTINNLAANTNYTLKIRLRRADSQLYTESSTLSTKTYAKTTPTISLSSKTINSITVTSGCNVSVSSTQYRIKTSNGSYGSYQTSATFSGLSANTSYVVEVRKVGTDSGEVGTATLAVTTYNYATISEANNFNLGDSEAVSYLNPSGSTINIGIYSIDGMTAYAGYRLASGSSYTFSFTDAELDAMYKVLGNNNSIVLRIYLRTTCNSTNYYSTKDVTITLKGNQKTAHVGVNNVQKRVKVFVGVNNSVKRAVVWIENNGRKRCI